MAAPASCAARGNVLHGQQIERISPASWYLIESLPVCE
jgi:hypothetical protein